MAPRPWLPAGWMRVISLARLTMCSRTGRRRRCFILGAHCIALQSVCCHRALLIGIRTAACAMPRPLVFEPMLDHVVCHQASLLFPGHEFWRAWAACWSSPSAPTRSRARSPPWSLMWKRLATASGDRFRRYCLCGPADGSAALTKEKRTQDKSAHSLCPVLCTADSRRSSRRSWRCWRHRSATLGAQCVCCHSAPHHPAAQCTTPWLGCCVVQRTMRGPPHDGSDPVPSTPTKDVGQMWIFNVPCTTGWAPQG